MEFNDVANWIATFYPEVDGYMNAPEFLIISWDHSSEGYEDLILGLTPLLRMKASRPVFIACFRSRQLIEADQPNIACEECGHMTNCGCEGDCDHAVAMTEAQKSIFREYSYLDALNELMTIFGRV